MNPIPLFFSGTRDLSHAAYFPGAIHSSGEAFGGAVSGGMISGGTVSGGTASGIRKAPGAEPIRAAAQEALVPANTDWYTPGKKPDAVGRYWPGKDENGRPKIYQDGPQQDPVSAASPKEQPGPNAPGDLKNPDAPGSAASNGGTRPEIPNGSAPDADGPAKLSAGPEEDASRSKDGANCPNEANHPSRPESTAGENAEKRCTVNTDRVDREIERLKQERQELERQLRGEADETKRQTVQQRLEQVERELSQKDNDAYRRRNAVYTYF